MATEYSFEGTIWFPEDGVEVDENYMDLKAFYYGDKHQSFSLNVTPGTVKKVEK